MSVVAWQEVLNDWRVSEEESWAPFYRDRGFASWWEWRRSYVEALGLENKLWEDEIVDDPHAVVPQLVVGGYRGWHKYRPAGKDLATFADIAVPPKPGEIAYNGAPREDVRTNEKVRSLVGNLRDTTLLVLRAPGFVGVLDGTHRAASIAVEAADGVHSTFALRVRSCVFLVEDRPLLEALAKDRGIVMRKPGEGQT